MVKNQKRIYLSEAMKRGGKKIKIGALNLINAPTGSGKNFFVFHDLIKNTHDYLEYPITLMGNKRAEDKVTIENKKSRVLYVCDTTMLLESTMAEYPFVKKLGKGVYKEAREWEESEGTIKVCTYSSLGWWVKNTPEQLERDIDVIVFDELQNLVKYAIRYNVEYEKDKCGEYILDRNGDKVKILNDEGNYVDVLKALPRLCNNVHVIALSGTEKSAVRFLEENIEVNIRCVFTSKERQELRAYNFDPIYSNCIMNQIKTIDWDCIKAEGKKVLIYTNRIATMESYKEWLDRAGVNAQWLCSKNAKRVVEEDGQEVEVPVMNEIQLAIRQQLIERYDVPEDLTVLIINSSMETGFNIKDKAFKIAMIDCLNEEEQIQSRMRIRQDIDILYCKALCNSEYVVCRREKGAGKLIPIYFNGKIKKAEITEMKDIPQQYLDIKLVNSSKRNDKANLLYLYGLKRPGAALTFESFSADLIKNKYVVKKHNRGTYIYKDKPKKEININDYLEKKLGDKEKMDIREHCGAKGITDPEFTWKVSKGMITETYGCVFENSVMHAKGWVKEKKRLSLKDKIESFMKDKVDYLFEDDIEQLKKIIGTDKIAEVNKLLEKQKVGITLKNKPSHGKKRWKIV